MGRCVFTVAPHAETPSYFFAPIFRLSTQMVYLDPPYGIKYKSNFQPFVGSRNVAESDQDRDLTTEPEMIKAFRDTWELGLHSYLNYLYDRLFLARQLLSDTGSWVLIGASTYTGGTNGNGGTLRLKCFRQIT